MIKSIRTVFKVLLFMIVILIIISVLAALLVILVGWFQSGGEVAVIILLTILGLILSFLIVFSSLKLYPKSTKKERQFLCIAGLIICIYLSLFPFDDAPIVFWVFASLSEEPVYVLYYVLALLAIFFLSMPSNLIILDLLRGSSQLEGRIRAWLKGSWFGKSLKKIDFFLYQSSGDYGGNTKSLKGWRCVLSPFPLTISWVLFIIVQRFLMFEYEIADSNSYEKFNRTILGVLSGLFLISGVIIHFYSPPTSRKFKYDVMLSALALMPVSTFYSKGHNFSVLILNSNEFANMCGFLFGIIFLLSIIRSRQIFITLLPKRRDRLMKLVRWNTIVLIPILIMSIGKFGSIAVFFYFLIRYYLIDWLFERPILYFRSFKSDTIQDFFTNVIAKVASKYGVVIGLVHTEDINEDYRSNNRVSERARLFMTSNDSWKDWVIKHLKKASVVIIHLDIKTEGVVWEVNISKELVGSENVIILEPQFELDSADDDYYKYHQDALGKKLDNVFLNSKL